MQYKSTPHSRLVPDGAVFAYRLGAFGESQPYGGHLHQQCPVLRATDRLSEPHAIPCVLSVGFSRGHPASRGSNPLEARRFRVPSSSSQLNCIAVNNLRGANQSSILHVPRTSGRVPVRAFAAGEVRKSGRCATPQLTGDMSRNAVAWRASCRRSIEAHCWRSPRPGADWRKKPSARGPAKGSADRSSRERIERDGFLIFWGAAPRQHSERPDRRLARMPWALRSHAKRHMLPRPQPENLS